LGLILLDSSEQDFHFEILWMIALIWTRFAAQTTTSNIEEIISIPN